MATGSRYFSKVQYGKELISAHGTPVAATKILLGKIPEIKNDREPEFPPEDVGVRADAIRSVVHQYLYLNTLTTPHGYFQQLPMLFGCGLKGNVTPTEVTPSQGDWLWPFTPSLIAGVSNTPDSLSLELGDDLQAFKSEYCMFERIRISGQVSQGMEASPVGIEADFFGRQLMPSTFTPAVPLPSAEPLNAKLSRFYLDTAWAGIGGTEKTNTLRGFDIELLSGLHPVFSGSGIKSFDTHAEGLIVATANFTFEGNANANAMFNAQQAQTFQAVRLQINGGVIGAGTPHSLKVDIGGVWKNVSPLGGEDRSDNLHTATLRGYLDPVGAKLLQVAVVTDSNSY